MVGIRGFFDPYRGMEEGDHDAEKNSKAVAESNTLLVVCCSSAVLMTIYCLISASYVPWLRGHGGAVSDFAPKMYPPAELMKVYYVNGAADVEKRRFMEAQLGGVATKHGHERIVALEATRVSDLAPPSEIGAFISSTYP